ncbi:MAG TPA: CDP-6-deoxy-delta-3,4-glucoseen reductase [Ramlibacter sp.]|jgi:CDP-4-dehydro-6-deoxyglucose reductase|nr:CDP-6-deoxy-delta-3,4-glucoseen reductase [Ramlibacter sp.]
MEYTVTLQPSGHTYKCSPETEVLKAGLAAGLFMPYSCRAGVCNTCRGRVVQGSVNLGAVLDKYLSEEDRAKGYALLCQATPRSDITVEVDEIEASGTIRPKFLPVRILEKRKLADDVMMLRVGLPMTQPVIFRAGQYLEFLRPNGERRSYSIASAPTNEGLRQVELHVRHMPGGKFTEHVFGTMAEREVQKVEIPLGSFFLRENSTKPIVMIASGTGFAPIQSILLDMMRRKIERPVTLYWGGRKRGDLYRSELCEQWARENASWFKYVPVLSEPTPQCRWEGRTGLVHRAVMDDLRDLSEHQVYACGTPAMVDAARHDFSAERRLPAAEFYADSFLTAKEKAATA